MSIIPKKPFIFIRHGQTDWNKQEITMGSKDIPLNELGRKQALEAQQKLGDMSFQVIYSSSLARTIETTQIINEKFKVQVLISSKLVERRWGAIEGKPHSVRKSRSPTSLLPEGAESDAEFRGRVVTAFQEILSGTKETIVPLVVSHGGLFKILAELLANNNQLRADNCSIFKFDPPTHNHDLWDIKESG